MTFFWSSLLKKKHLLLKITPDKAHILDFVLTNKNDQTFKISNRRFKQCGISDHHIVLVH